MEVTHSALCSSGSGKPYCDCGAEVQALRAELAWRSEERDRYKSVLDAALREMEEMRQQLAACREIFTWLLGEGDEFPLRPEGKGLYWWRKELRERIAAARKGEGEE